MRWRKRSHNDSHVVLHRNRKIVRFVHLARCGEVLFSHAAIFSLHFLVDLSAVPPPVDETAKFQKIIYTKRGPAGGDLAKTILRYQVRHVG